MSVHLEHLQHHGEVNCYSAKSYRIAGNGKVGGWSNPYEATWNSSTEPYGIRRRFASIHTLGESPFRTMLHASPSWVYANVHNAVENQHQHMYVRGNKIGYLQGIRHAGWHCIYLFEANVTTDTNPSPVITQEFYTHWGSEFGGASLHTLATATIGEDVYFTWQTRRRPTGEPQHYWLHLVRIAANDAITHWQFHLGESTDNVDRGAGCAYNPGSGILWVRAYIRYTSNAADPVYTIEYPITSLPFNGTLPDPIVTNSIDDPDHQSIITDGLYDPELGRYYASHSAGNFIYNDAADPLVWHRDPTAPATDLSRGRCLSAGDHQWHITRTLAPTQEGLGHQCYFRLHRRDNSGDPTKDWHTVYGHSLVPHHNAWVEGFQTQPLFVHPDAPGRVCMIATGSVYSGWNCTKRIYSVQVPTEMAWYPYEGGLDGAGRMETQTFLAARKGIDFLEDPVPFYAPLRPWTSDRPERYRMYYRRLGDRVPVSAMLHQLDHDPVPMTHHPIDADHGYFEVDLGYTNRPSVWDPAYGIDTFDQRGYDNIVERNVFILKDDLDNEYEWKHPRWCYLPMQAYYNWYETNATSAHWTAHGEDMAGRPTPSARQYYPSVVKQAPTLDPPRWLRNTASPSAFTMKFMQPPRRSTGTYNNFMDLTPNAHKLRIIARKDPSYAGPVQAGPVVAMDIKRKHSFNGGWTFFMFFLDPEELEITDTEWAQYDFLFTGTVGTDGYHRYDERASSACAAWRAQDVIQAWAERYDIDRLISSNNYTPFDLEDIAHDTGDPPDTWAAWPSEAGAIDTEVVFEFDNYWHTVEPPSSNSGFRLRAWVKPTGTNSDIACRIDWWRESDSSWQNGSAVSNLNANGQLVQRTMTGFTLNQAEYHRMRVVGLGAGGSPAARGTVAIDAIDVEFFNPQVTATGAGVDIASYMIVPAYLKNEFSGSGRAEVPGPLTSNGANFDRSNPMSLLPSADLAWDNLTMEVPPTIYSNIDAAPEDADETSFAMNIMPGHASGLFDLTDPPPTALHPIIMRARLALMLRDPYQYEVFTEDGWFDWDAAGKPDECDVIIVGAGGNGRYSSGGGAGAFRLIEGVPLTGDVEVIIGQPATSVTGDAGSSFFGALEAIAGGRGGNGITANVAGDPVNDPTPGGSGGGGGGTTNTSIYHGIPGALPVDAMHGHAGGAGAHANRLGTGMVGGGGGGAGGPGEDGGFLTRHGLRGGVGIDLRAIGWRGAIIAGAPVFLAGGGGGSTSNTSTHAGGPGGLGGGGRGGGSEGAGQPGEPNTGGGGGGHLSSGGWTAGGSGIVIARHTGGVGPRGFDAGFDKGFG